MSAQLEHRRFNVTEYYQMAAAGILTPDDRVELIEGEIIKMSPIGSPHAACVSRLVRLANRLVDESAIVWVQNPVRLSNFTEPVPDVALLKPRADYYAARHPVPDDALLLIEVADSSLLKDRNVKIPLYARSGIPEVWLINLPKAVIEVYTELQNAQYSKVLEFDRAAVVVSSSLEGWSIPAADILG